MCRRGIWPHAVKQKRGFCVETVVMAGSPEARPWAAVLSPDSPWLSVLGGRAWASWRKGVQRLSERSPRQILRLPLILHVCVKRGRDFTGG